MKKILLLLFLLPLFVVGQNRFPSIDSAKNYSLRYVKNSAVESFTNLRMQNVVYGTLQLLDSLCGTGAIDTIYKSGDTLKYKIGSQVFTVGVFGGSSLDTTSLSHRIDLRLPIGDTSLMLQNYKHWTQGYLTAVPTLQQVTTQGNSTTDSINIIDGSGNRLISLNKRSSGPPTDLGGLIRIKNNFNSFYSDYYATGIYFQKTNSNSIGFPDSSGTLPLRIKLNSTFFSAANNGTIDLGTITATPDSSIFATRFWVNSNYIATGSSASLQNLTITGTNGNGHIHLRHQSTLPTATGQSTTIYANSQGNFAWKNDGNYHTTLKTDANTADRTYTFQNKDYTLADNAEVVKYTDTSSMLSPYLRKIDTASLSNRINLKLNISDTSSMLNGRISSITLNTSGAIHTNPITFSRIGGAWSGTMSLSTQTANRVFAGPTTGGAATPTFRALVDADIPSTSKGVQWTGVDSSFAYQQARNGYHENADFGGAFGTSGLSVVDGTKYTFSGLTSLPTATDTAFGYIIQSTSTSSTGQASLWHGHAAAIQPWINMDLDAIWFATRIKIPAHSLTGETFDYRIGLSSTIVSQGALVDAATFVYDPQGSYTGSAASNNWQVATCSTSVRTWTTTSTVVSNGWTNLAIRATNTNVQYFINGNLVATHTNNIPTAFLSPVSQLWKRTGVTPRTLFIDFITLDKTYSIPR